MRFPILILAVTLAFPSCAFADYSAAVSAVEKGDYPQALKELKPLLEQRDKDAQYLMGFMYFGGLGVERNLRNAIRYFRQASDQGHEYARFLLGVSLNMNGDFPEAAKHLQWAAGKDHADAQYLLAMMYIAGRGVPEDLVEAVRLLRAASDSGNLSATTKLGQLNYVGQGMKKDPVEAARLFRLAAEKGDGHAQLLLAEALYFGEGIPANPKEAVSWYLKAAAKGDRPDAAGRLGWAYHEGKGVERNDREAAKWLKLGADGGSAFAQLALGSFYRDGIGVETNLVTALMWMKLAEAKNFSASAEQIQYTVQFMTPEQVKEASRLARQRVEKNGTQP